MADASCESHARGAVASKFATFRICDPRDGDRTHVVPFGLAFVMFHWACLDT